MNLGGRHDDKTRRALAFALIVLTIGAYLPVLSTGGFIWDDDAYVTRNALLWSPGGLYRIWFELGATSQYYPLTYTTFWIEYRLWDLWPTGYHFVNILLHGGNAVLVWLILETLAVPGAWFIAAVFALHPVHVESTAWITERKNVLSGIFYLLALRCYLRFSPSLFSLSEQALRVWRYYGLAGFFFICALLSKTVTCSLPAAILLLGWWKKRKITVNDLLPLLPLLCVGLGMALVTVWVEKRVVGAVGETWALSSVEKILLAGRALWFYMGKLVWPFPVAFFYSRWEIDALVWWQYLFPMGAVALVSFLVALVRYCGPAPLVAVLFFTGTLVPALGFFDVYSMRYSYVADHFQYLASIGVLALIGGCLWYTPSERQQPHAREFPSVWLMLQNVALHYPYRLLVSCVILLITTSLTWKQGYIYENAQTVWLDTIHKTPTSWMPYNNLGILAMQDGDYSLATAYFEKTVALNPASAEGHMNLCTMYKKAGRFAEARYHGERALTLSPQWRQPQNCLRAVRLATKDEPQTPEVLSSADSSLHK